MREVVASEEIEVPHVSGERGFVSMNSAPVLAADGRVVAGVVVALDITERRRAERALREADRRKDEFLAMLSHELRNPLASIRNSLAVLDRIGADSPQAWHSRQVIDRQMSQLVRLVDDLLDVTRIARGKVTIQRERVEFGELVRRILLDHRTAFENAGGLRTWS